MQQTLASQNQVASPFLKWAGGKTQQLGELQSHIPSFHTYYEPFVGGGALFFHLASSKSDFRAYLSDLNAELVNAYRVVKNNVEELICNLGKHETSYFRDPEGFYYDLRGARPISRIEKAARLVALNKTCYNGLYRVNSTGAFNVPMGRYRNPLICNLEQLRNASAALAKTKASIRTCGYAAALSNAGKGDFVYLDPPFVPLSRTSNFVNYTREGFNASDQGLLAKIYRNLHRKGCRVLLSNSDTKLARELYSEFNQFRIRVSRAISCKGDARTGFTELLVRNYTP